MAKLSWGEVVFQTVVGTARKASYLGLMRWKFFSRWDLPPTLLLDTMGQVDVVGK